MRNTATSYTWQERYLRYLYRHDEYTDSDNMHVVVLCTPWNSADRTCQS
jgi:hypothetical protein